MIRLSVGTAGAVAAGVVAFYLARFCVTGLVPGDCGLDLAGWVLQLDPVAGREVRR
jgi:hypothetical protein